MTKLKMLLCFGLLARNNEKPEAAPAAGYETCFIGQTLDSRIHRKNYLKQPRVPVSYLTSQEVVKWRRLRSTRVASIDALLVAALC
jgi:hypothetical protein